MAYTDDYDFGHYLNTRYKGPEHPEDPFSTFAVTSIHQFFQSHCSSLQQQQKLSVLDYGCGAVIANVISASQYASDIVLAEYTESGRVNIQQWLERAPTAFDWSDYFKYIVQKLEEKSESETKAREEKLRQQIKAIVECDITQDPPISPQYTGPYDIVISILCINNAAETTEEFNIVFNRLISLVKLGGYLLFMADVTATPDSCLFGHYTFDGRDFPTFLVPKGYVQSLLKKSGFSAINVIYDSGKNESTIFQFVTARKSES